MVVIYCEKGKIPFTYFSIIAVFSSLWGEYVCKNVYFVCVCVCTPHTPFFNDFNHLKHCYLSNTSHGITTWSTIYFTAIHWQYIAVCELKIVYCY
jgi:hypothetical protein